MGSRGAARRPRLHAYPAEIEGDPAIYYISALCNAGCCLVPGPMRRVQRVPGHHGAHGRSGEPGHHDGQVEGTPPQPHPARSCAALWPGLRPSCSHRAALVHRSRRCSMRLRGSRATLERRTASTRFACPTPSTWCAGAPPTQLTRDAMLGCLQCIVPCVAVAGLCRLSDPPEAVGLSACIHQTRKQCRGARGGGGVGALVRSRLRGAHESLRGVTFPSVCHVRPYLAC